MDNYKNVPSYIQYEVRQLSVSTQPCEIWFLWKSDTSPIAPIGDRAVLRRVTSSRSHTAKNRWAVVNCRNTRTRSRLLARPARKPVTTSASSWDFTSNAAWECACKLFTLRKRCQTSCGVVLARFSRWACFRLSKRSRPMKKSYASLWLDSITQVKRR